MAPDPKASLNLSFNHTLHLQAERTPAALLNPKEHLVPSGLAGNQIHPAKTQTSLNFSSYSLSASSALGPTFPSHSAHESTNRASASSVASLPDVLTVTGAGGYGHQGFFPGTDRLVGAADVQGGGTCARPRKGKHRTSFAFYEKTQKRANRYPTRLRGTDFARVASQGSDAAQAGLGSHGAD